MKNDLYIKVILTVIAIGVAIPLLSNSPVINNASKRKPPILKVNDKTDMIASSDGYLFQLRNGKVRVCYDMTNEKPYCSPWSD